MVREMMRGGLWGGDKVYCKIQDLTPLVLEARERACISIMVVLMILMIMIMVVSVSNSYAGEINNKSDPSAITNIGFMNPIPEKLKEKFPMCDCFLNVEWIDKKNKIGYSNYEAIIKGGKKKFWTLIYVDDVNATHTWDVYKFKRQGRLKDLFEMIEYGTDEGDALVRIPTYKGKSAAIHYISFERGRDSIADFRLNVCVPYPDEQKVWIIEGKKVKNVYNESETLELLKRAGEFENRPPNREYFDSLWVLDVNFDGHDDFVFERLLVASWSNKIYVAHNEYDSVKQEVKFLFPPNGRSCQMDFHGLFTLTTDGKNYYLNNCNITDLTSIKGKE